MAYFNANTIQKKRICETAHQLRVWGLSKEEVNVAADIAETDDIMFGVFEAWSEAGKDEKNRLANVIVEAIGSQKRR